MFNGVRKWWLVLGGIVLAAIALWYFLRPESTARTGLGATHLLSEPVAVAPGVYLLGATSPAAVYAIETSEGLVLIDSGMEAAAEPIIEQLARLQLNTERLRAVLLTHVHADHSLGARYFRVHSNAEIYAGRADCTALRNGGPREAFFSTYHVPGIAAHPTAVDVELAGDETLDFGDTKIEVIPAPGHTAGSVCYRLGRQGLTVLFTGDVVQRLYPDGAGTLGTATAYLPPLYGGNVQSYLKTLRRLRALPVPDLILPGHPRMDPFPQNPRLTAQRWHALLDAGIREMERLAARYEADGADFLDGIRKELLPGLHYLGNFGGSAIYCLDTPKGLILIDAPGDDFLSRFLERRFEELGWSGRKLAAVLLTSTEPGAMAGLGALTRSNHCEVVAPPGAQAEIRTLCAAGTPVITPQEFLARKWLDAQVISLGGRGRHPLAYQMRWSGKTTLFTGRFLVKLTAVTSEVLTRDLQLAGGNAQEFARSLAALAELDPDLWLPARPVHGQNANLYDDDWSNCLAHHRQVLR